MSPVHSFISGGRNGPRVNKEPAGGTIPDGLD
jgi:hypothetical protein